MTFRETCLPGGMMEEVGAVEALRSGFVGGTRREAAADGGGRINPLPGLGGGARLPKLGGFRRGGLDGLIGGADDGGVGLDIWGVSGVFTNGISAFRAGGVDSSALGGLVSSNGTGGTVGPFLSVISGAS